MLHDRNPWSANRRYHSVIIDAIPQGCQRLLDVGCGLGELTRDLRRHVPEVSGIDADLRSIEMARAHPDAADIAYIHDDFLIASFPEASFDMVVTVASLHHMSVSDALLRMRDLLRPHGVLAVVGLARAGSATDFALSVPAAVGKLAHQFLDACNGTGVAGYHAPLRWPPPETYGSMRRLAGHLLPGVRYRRHLYWRYSLIWSKPD